MQRPWEKAIVVGLIDKGLSLRSAGSAMNPSDIYSAAIASS